jgi:transposase
MLSSARIKAAYVDASSAVAYKESIKSVEVHSSRLAQPLHHPNNFMSIHPLALIPTILNLSLSDSYGSNALAGQQKRDTLTIWKEWG